MIILFANNKLNTHKDCFISPILTSYSVATKIVRQKLTFKQFLPNVKYAKNLTVF